MTTATATAATETTPTARAPSQDGTIGRLAVVLGAGLGVGIATSVLQAYLNAPWSSLVNAASPWLAGAFAVGTLWRRTSSAAVAGLAVCVLELVGYYSTATARGYSASHTELVFWGACSLIGGPALGCAGWLWWRGPQRLRGLGASVIAAAFLAESAVVYAWRLHYTSSALLFAVIGLTLIASLGVYRHQHVRIALWLGAALPAGLVAEWLLDLIHRATL
jgi:hypothetical protein